MEERIKSNENPVLRDRWVTGRHLDAERIIFIGTKTASVYKLRDMNLERENGNTYYAEIEHNANVINKLFGGEIRPINNIKRQNIYPETIYINGIPTILVFQNEGASTDSPLPIMQDMDEFATKNLEMKLESMKRRIDYYQEVFNLMAESGVDLKEFMNKARNMDTQQTEFTAHIGSTKDKKK